MKKHFKMSSSKLRSFLLHLNVLIHWGRVAHICAVDLAITGSDNGLSPDRHQAITWTDAVILSIGPCPGNRFHWNFNQNTTIFIEENGPEYVVWKMTAVLSQPNVLVNSYDYGWKCQSLPILLMCNCYCYCYCCCFCFLLPIHNKIWAIILKRIDSKMIFSF